MGNRIRTAVIAMAALMIFAGCKDAPQETAGDLPPLPAQSVDEEEVSLPEDILPEEVPPPAVTYVLNTSSKKFHKPSCRSVELMKPANFRETSETRDQVLERGYTPCGNCKP